MQSPWVLADIDQAWNKIEGLAKFFADRNNGADPKRRVEKLRLASRKRQAGHQCFLVNRRLRGESPSISIHQDIPE